MRTHRHRRLAPKAPASACPVRRRLGGLYSPELLESRIAPATFVVTNPADSPIATAGTLSAAIEGINGVGGANNTPGADIITFDPVLFPGGAPAIITLFSGQIEITDDLTIKGPGADLLTISGNTFSRIFKIDDGTNVLKTVAISGLSLIKGGVTGGDGGGIFCTEALTLQTTVISGCSTDGKSGGIYVNNTGNIGNGTLTIDRCSIVQNSAGIYEGGLYANSKGTVKITNTVVRGNTATNNVGGLYINIAGAGTGDIILKNVTISNNSSTAADKGGAGFDNDRPGGKITLANCTVTGNTAADSAGGLYFNSGIVVIDKSTIAGNTATAGKGGGIKVGGGASLSVTKSSILNNSAAVGGGLANLYGPLAISGSSFFGNRATDPAKAGGGAVYLKGAALVSIQSSLFSGNTSAAGGGAITVGGNATNPSNALIKSSSILGNTAGSTGGGINFVPQAGESLVGSVVTLTGSVVSGNVANGGSGGGVYATGGGAVVVNGGQFAGNYAAFYGGGLATAGDDAKGVKLDITGTLFTGNSAENGGGVDAQGGGQVTVVKAKLVGNFARGNYGGGMDLRSTTSISVSDSLFERNHAAGYGGGLATHAGATFLVSGSQFFGNTAIEGGGGIALLGSVAGQVLKSTISGNTSGTFGGGLINTTVVAVDLMGTKITGNFAPGAPNLYGTPTNFTDVATPVAGGGIVVTSLKDDGSDTVDEITLREAIVDMANMTPGKQTITFDPTLFPGGALRTITLNGTDIDITGPLVIKGPGVEFLTISGNNASRIFNINDGNSNKHSLVAISDLVLTKGKAVAADLHGDGGAIHSEDSLSLERTVVTGNNAADSGAGISIGTGNEKLVVKNSVFTGNTGAGEGGALYAATTGGVLISKSMFAGNQALSGGALYSDNFTNKRKAVVVDSCVIVANLATNGGGIKIADDLGSPPTVIKNSVISGNTASVKGGGIYVSDEGQLKLSKSVVSNNSAPLGGGLADIDNSLTISGTAFLANRATDPMKAGGGALYLKGNPLVSIESSLFSGNTSAAFGGGISIKGDAGNPAKVSIKGSIIQGNTADGSGGGIALIGTSALTLPASIVSGNVGDAGGGIYGIGSAGALTVKGGKFEGNRAAAGFGGGIFASGMGANISGTVFAGNTAQSGGGVYALSGAAIQITSAKFTGNLATLGAGGGAFLKSDVSVKVLGTIFQGNHAAGRGGGLAIDIDGGVIALVTTSKFFDNSSDGSGGGVALLGTKAGAITKSTVTGNVAGVSGGGIFNNTGDPLDISGTNPTGNWAPTDPNVSGAVLP